jgi:HK97 gp10 family phage protein
VATSITWSNLPQFQKAIEEAVHNVRDSTPVMVEQMTRTAVARAKAIVPVDTGRLRASISGDVTGKQLVVGTISANTHYAAYVEFGTSRMGARPYLRPAMLQAQNWWSLQSGSAVKW